MTTNGHASTPVTFDGDGARARVELEACFSFLGVDVHVVCDSLRQHQYWTSVYTAFCTYLPSRPHVTIRTRGDASAGSLTATISYDGRTVAWDGESQLLPPLDLPAFNRWLQLQGAMVSRAGHGVLVLGRHGFGKTRLALSGVARGALLLADGMVPLSLDDLLAHPFPRSLRIRRDELHDLDIPASHPALRPFRTRDGDIQWRADPRALFPTRFSRTASEVAAVVVLDRARQATPELRPLAPDEAIVALITHIHGRPSDRRAAIDALARLVDAAPAYSLTAGAPAATAELLDSLLLS